MAKGFDIIGDIHGHLELLEALLAKMGYRKDAGIWRHPAGRRVVFCGDLIDRGPLQTGTLETVRRMTEAGSALCVMGNHEYNAIQYSLDRRTLKPKDPHISFLAEMARRNPECRELKGKERDVAFLTQMARGNPEYHAWIRWCLELPLWLDLGSLCVIHACWDPKTMAFLKSVGLRDGNRLTFDLCLEATAPGKRQAELTRGQKITDAIEVILKGPELKLPKQNGKQVTFKDKEGVDRDGVRSRWWLPNTMSLREAAFTPDPSWVPDVLLEESSLVHEPDRPTFVGHYWLREEDGIAPLTPKLACLDYSAGRGGPLVAYRWNEGETTLAADQFVSVRPAEAPAPEAVKDCDSLR